ncbi:MAG: Maf family nucleotide pyrophosphatase [Gammaproteobacteria bacterium]|nr:Maf family nucleotide pyrophosphatase [Gammaproteobacteria bacterium]
MSPQLYLASSSPRRRELLDQVGLCYVQLRPEVNETALKNESPAALVQRLARLKAEAGLNMMDPDVPLPVLGADTVVVLQGKVFGKPDSEDAALSMLAQLSGQTHQVLTAVAVAAAGQAELILSITEVTFKEISAEMARAYWQTGESQDKAGAYAIQGRAALFVEKIEGSYSGVVGLPLMETAELLMQFGVEVMSGSAD